MAGRLEGRIALVTGASRGIGAAVAQAFAREGAHLVLAARTTGGLEEIDDAIRAQGLPAATLIPIDLTDFEKLDQMVLAVAQRFGRLDVLVGNAGMLGGLYPVGHMPVEMWNRVMALNFTANWRLIRACDALLRVSESGRAIFTTAKHGSEATPYWSAYAASKAALEMTVRMYAGEISKTSIRCNLIDPGAVRTKLRAQAFPGEDPQKLPAPDQIAPLFVDLAEASCRRHGQVVRAY
jgi:NAD(P)-dependent dehydrogenase (short-subunit alcohol dehydrogenase family)